MQIRMTGTNIAISEGMKRIVGNKLEIKLDKYLQNFAEDMKVAQLTIRIDPKQNFKVKFSMWLPGKEQIFAYSRADDFTAAIVILREELERQILKYKGKLQTY